MLSGIILLWYILTFLSLIVLIYDLTTNTPTVGIMKVAWVLILLYTGPVGLVIYLLSCRQPLPDTHDQFIKAHWKQSIGSMMHCIAGDATGIIVSAAIVFHFGLPNGIDLIVEYLAAFVVGLLIFQAVFMRGMYGGNYLKAVRKTFFAETVSMNMVMVGMFPVMLILMHHIPDGDNPTRPEFWWIMSMATLAGMITAYAINSWMVRKEIKHGMMTKPKPGTEMPAMEHHEMAPALSTAKMIGVMALTFAILFGVLFLTSRFIPISFH